MSSPAPRPVPGAEASEANGHPPQSLEPAGSTTPLTPSPRSRRARGVALACGVLGLAFAGTGYRYDVVRPEPVPELGTVAGAAPSREAAGKRAEQRRLVATLRRAVPTGVFVVIDQTHNRLRLMRGEELLLDTLCSTGSGMVLKQSESGRVWVFDTPRGRFKVLSKLKNPIWRKPDWAFVEEGRPVPRDPGERLEYGVLGEYALYFGNGYLIHGTLYERLIGRPVSHGCIRVGREALRQLYRQVPVGAPVFIY